MNLAVKDSLLGLGALDANDIAEFERSFRFDELSVQEIEEMLDIDVLERLCAQLDTPVAMWAKSQSQRVCMKA